MTENTFYQKYREFIVIFYTITIAVTSGFGIQYLLLATTEGDTVLYSQFASLVMGTGLGIIYILTEAQNIRLKKEVDSDGQ